MVAGGERTSGDEVVRLRGAGPAAGAVLAELFDGHRDRLARLVALRLRGALRGRVSASDVLQEAYLRAAAELPGYVADPRLPFGLWLRTLALQKLTELHRRHLGVQARAAGREVSLFGAAAPGADSGVLAAQLAGDFTSPSGAAARAELRQAVRAALDGMDSLDREVLALRHFEQLSNQEAAVALGITPQAASNRYVRALVRLKRALPGDPSAGGG